MELSWLEDFVELAAVRNFSTAAAARHITQPAFSRRIRALENWVGAELIDRSSYPVTLTKAGETFLEAGRDIMRGIYLLRDECREQAKVGIETLSLSALHTIALSIFPELLSVIEDRAGPFITRMTATDFYNCIEALALGRCEMALCYSHPLGPPILHTGQFASKRIAIDPFRPISAAGRDGEPLFALTQNGPRQPLPLVSYSSDCFLGKVQSDLVHDLRREGQEFYTVYENSMSETVKRIIQTGKGIGWLPESAVRKEIADGSLISLASDQPDVRLDVMAFRKTGAGSPVMERFWSLLPQLENARDSG